MFFYFVQCVNTSYHGDADPFDMWPSVDEEFDSAVRMLEHAYCFVNSSDSIWKLTCNLEKLVAEDSLSDVKRGRLHYFKARFYDAFSLYSKEWKEKSAREVKMARKAYADTSKYAYDMYRLRYIESKNKSRSIDCEYFDNVRALSEARYFGDSLTVAGLLNNIGNILAELGDSTVALGCFNRSKTIFNSLGIDKWEKRVMLSMALSMRSSSPWKSDSIMQSLLRYSSVAGDTILSMALLHNLYAGRENPEYIDMASRLASGNPAYADMQAYCNALRARYFLKKGIHPDSAVALSRLALVSMHPSMRLEYAMTVYLAASEAMHSLGMLDSAFEFRQLYRQLSDSVNYESVRLNAMKNIALRKIAQYEAKSISRQNEGRMIYLIAVFVVILVLAGIIVFIYRRQSRMHMSKMKMELDLAQNQLQLVSSRLVIEENENVIEKAMKAVTTMRDEGKITGTDAASVLGQLNNHIANRDEMNTLRQKYESLNPKFTKLIKERWPGLTEGNVRLATYIAIGMTNRQIAQIMMVEYRSIITSRYRLRMKMGLDKDDSLEDILKEFAKF